MQDGGLLTNNPCAVALHEARLLWGRSTPIQCVISLGTGLYMERTGKDKQRKENNTSLKEKLTKIVASATDTEGISLSLPPSLSSLAKKVVITAMFCRFALLTGMMHIFFYTLAVHTILKDLLPPSTYFRFNPELTDDIAIDESKPEKLEQLVQDANRYIRDNHELLRLAALTLTAKKRPQQRAEEWVWSQLNKAQSKLSVRLPR